MDHSALRHILMKLRVQRLTRRPNAAGWLHAECPFAPFTHKNRVDRSASFAIKVEDDGVSAFRCPTCKQHGRISHLARTLGFYRQEDYGSIALEADEADLKGLSNIAPFEDAGYQPTVPIPLEEALFEGLFDDIEQWPVASTFLAKRRVSLETARKLELGYDPEKQRIVFPVRGPQGELYGWTGRTVANHSAKVMDYEGLPKRALILGANRWQHGRPTVIVEGLFAFARFHEIGVEEEGFNIGALLGSYLTPEKAAILQGFDESVYWFLDPDPAGDDGLYGRPIEVRVQPVAPSEDDEPPEDEEPPPVQRDREGSALYMMNGHVPQFVPKWPADDPDDLSIAQFRWMTKTAELWLPEPEPANASR